MHTIHHRRAGAASPIFSALARGIDTTAPGRRPVLDASTRSADPSAASATSPIFDQLADRRISRRRSNFIPRPESR
jgi:hypothetical protein